MNSLYNSTEQSKIKVLAKDGILVEWLSGLCPVQGNGWIDEKHAFYFHARHDEWYMCITQSEADKLDEALNDDGVWEYGEKYGKDPEAGYMSFIEALGFIEQSVNKFRAKQRTR